MPQLTLPLVTPETASDGARARLERVQKRYGFIPNLYGVFANAPIAIDAYLAVSDAFTSGTLSATERNVVWLAAARENGCAYCVAVHSTIADSQHQDPAITDAIRDGATISDPRLEALRALTQALVRGRGHAQAEVTAFLAAGFTASQVLEVLVGITMKTLSNYTNHLAETPLDRAFAKRAFTP